MSGRLVLLGLTTLTLAAGTWAADRTQVTDGIIFRISANRPENVSAFYEGRGFPPAALDALREACFLGVSVRNPRQEMVWLDLDRWRFTDDQGRAVERQTRTQWEERWRRLNVPRAHRATFGWTLLPESRDLHPDEPVAGNILLVPTTRPFHLEARFATGPDRSGPDIVVRVERLICHGPHEGGSP